MYLTRPTLDALLRDVLGALLREETSVKANRGKFTEVFGACLHLTNPLARLSRSEAKGTIYSALGELLWYLSGDTLLDFIDYYVPNRFQKESDDQIRVRSGYGDRLSKWRGLNQIESVINLLKKDSTSRRAVIQLFEAEDIAQRYKSIPCTCTLQFLARDGRLHMFTSMRSNDAYIGLPHDVFAFTMLQEIVARSLDLEVGEYKHCAGSLHLYEEDLEAAKKYLDEGWQDPVPMPAMPKGDPWNDISWLQEVEQAARLNKSPLPDIQAAAVETYWKDLARVLISRRASKDKDAKLLAQLKDQVTSPAYKMFLMARLDALDQNQARIGETGEHK